MGNVLKFGDTVALRNGQDNFSGYFLSLIWKGVQNPEKFDKLWTEVAQPGKNFASDYVWKIIPPANSAKKVGDPVANFEEVWITVQDDAGATRYLAINNVDNTYVMASDNSVATNLKTWVISGSTAVGPNNQASGDLKDPLEYGMFVNLLNKSLERTANAHNDANQTDAFKHVLRTASLNSPPDITGWWRIDKTVTDPGTSDNGGGDNGGGGERDGWFNLPPNIRFGVTVLVNSAAEQTVKVFVDDPANPSATFKGAGVDDKNLQTQIINSGKGKVHVVVEANGKQSKLGSRQVDIFKKTYFGLVGSEDGGDDDYNDALVILNWPLG
nr:hypothetical protein HUO10_003791 [Paraburkholderia busanensis]